MNIEPAVLENQFHRALGLWPFIPQIERQYGLPSMLLMAVGSRETNLTNEVGDNGHGNGVWQLDNRSHEIPKGFNSNVKGQAIKAAAMFALSLKHYKGNIQAAMVAYNAGQGTADYNLLHHLNIDSGTANGNYSTDTYGRLIHLQKWQGTSMSRTLTDDDIKAIWEYGITPGAFGKSSKHNTGTYIVQLKKISEGITTLLGRK